MIRTPGHSTSKFQTPYTTTDHPAPLRRNRPVAGPIIAYSVFSLPHFDTLVTRERRRRDITDCDDSRRRWQPGMPALKRRGVIRRPHESRTARGTNRSPGIEQGWTNVGHGSNTDFDGSTQNTIRADPCFIRGRFLFSPIYWSRGGEMGCRKSFQHELPTP